MTPTLLIVDDDPASVRALQDTLEAQAKYRARPASSRAAGGCKGGTGEPIGRSRAMERRRFWIARAAGTDPTARSTGESSTGKELVARALHTEDRRREATFVAIHCTALPESHRESELFGHERRAFTGDLREAWQTPPSVPRERERQLLVRALREHSERSYGELEERLGTSRRVLEARLHAFSIHKPRLRSTEALEGPRSAPCSPGGLR